MKIENPENLQKMPRAILSWKSLKPGELVNFKGNIGIVKSCRLLQMSYHVPKDKLIIRCGSQYLTNAVSTKAFYDALGYTSKRDVMSNWFQKPKFVFSCAEIEIHLLEFVEPLLELR